MPSTVSSQRRIERMLQLATTAVLVVVGAFCILLLSIRLIVFPQLEAHRAEIARWLSARIGQPVEIDAVRTGWDGWNPKLSIRGFRVGDRSASVSPLLDLPRVDLVVAWTSLPLLHLRLKELAIDSPRLWLRRDAQGRLHVAGVEIDPAADAGDTAFADWLLRQPRITVHDALLVWNDDLRAAPQLILDHVELRLEQRFGHWHIGLTGAPPSDLAAPVDLRADLTRGSRTDPRSLDGRVYLQLDYADIAAWGNWLPLPAPMASGKGALRMWVEMKDSRPQAGVADLELTDVAATLEPGLAPLTLEHLAGRARWKQTATRSDVSAEAFSFTLPDGTQVAPMNFSLHLDSPAAGSGAGGRLTFDRLDLAPLAAIAAAVPLPGRLRDDLLHLAPRGTLFDGAIAWTGEADAPDSFAARGRFDAVGFAPLGTWPGASNLRGSLEADQRHGTLRLAADDTTIALPRVFADPIALQHLDGNVEWVSGDEPLTLRFMGVSFANAQLAGTLAGTWRAGIDGPGVVDLGAQLTRANFADAWRYVPLAAGASLQTWLHRAFTQGTSNDAKLKLSGDLARFPFAAAAEGTFTASVAAKDVNFDYAEGWPAITGIDGTLNIDGPKLSFAATQGSVGDVRIAATQVSVADLRGPHAVLSVDGSATGPTRAFLDFIAASPVAGWIDHVADGATATGDGRLALKLDLPLGGPAPATVTGSYTMTDNAIRFSGAPQLDGVNGRLEFTQDGVRAHDIAAQAFGGAARLQLASGADGAVRVDATGTANLATLRTQFPVPLLDRVAGNADWRFTLTAKDGVPAWSIDSKLVGATIDLPAPLGKTAASSAALHVERQALGATADRIVADYAPAGRLLLHRSDGGAGLVADRALVLLGKAAASAAAPDRPGTWIRGNVAALDVDDWLAVDTGMADPAQAKETLAIEGVDIDADSLSALGRNFAQVAVAARRDGTDWRLRLEGDEVSGSAVWHGVDSAHPHGRLVARLAKLSLPAMPHAAAPAAETPAATAAVSRWPEVDLAAEAFASKGHALGALDLVADPVGPDWHIRKLALVNDAGRIDASGWWRNATGRSQTRLAVDLDIKDAGAFLGRFGWPGLIKGAASNIDGEVAWDGAPSAFDYPSLSGAFKLKSGAGQFTKIEPGVGRLLGVLSLQALPRRVTLDFRDVFSAGFAFDSVTGAVTMQNGIMHTDDLRLAGTAAIVDIAGDADLARETQKLKVRVQPSLASGISAGAAALFLANPLVGAAVGAGTLLAQKMFNNPFDQLFSYEYSVTGNWDDPVVTRSGAAVPHATAAMPPAAIAVPPAVALPPATAAVPPAGPRR